MEPESWLNGEPFEIVSPCQVRLRIIWRGLISKLKVASRRYITLQGEDDDPNDAFFWTPLVPCSSDTFQGKTLGQLLHFWFPNLRYIFRAASPATRFQPSKGPKPTVYLSDHNVIEKEDVSVLKKLFLDIQDRYEERKPSAKKQRSLDELPWFRADTVDRMDFDECLETVQNQYPINSQTTKRLDDSREVKQLEDMRRQAEIFAYFLPFRKIACFTWYTTTNVWVHLLTATDPVEMQGGMRQKVLDIFWMMRRMMDDVKVVDKMHEPQLIFEFEREEVTGDIRDCGFPRIQNWIDCVRFLEHECDGTLTPPLVSWCDIRQ